MSVVKLQLIFVLEKENLTLVLVDSGLEDGQDMSGLLAIQHFTFVTEISLLCAAC